MANRVIHFKIPATNTKSKSDFYAQTLSWRIKEQCKAFCEYIRVTSGLPIPTSI